MNMNMNRPNIKANSRQGYFVSSAIAFALLAIVVGVLVWFFVIKKKKEVYCEPKSGFPRTEQGKQAKADCPAGFKGSQTATCKADGTFEVPDVAGCTKIQCTTTPPAPFSGIAVAGESLVASCGDGFGGQQKLLCSADGTWTAQPDRTGCQKQCVPQAPFPTAAIAPGTSVSAACPTGYRGAITAKCNADGTMSVPTQDCASAPPALELANKMYTTNAKPTQVGFTAPASFTNLDVQQGTVVYNGVTYPTFAAGTYTVGATHSGKIAVTKGGNWLQVGFGYAILRKGAAEVTDADTKRIKGSGSLTTAGTFTVNLNFSATVTLQDGDAVLPMFQKAFNGANLTAWDAHINVTTFAISPASL